MNNTIKNKLKKINWIYSINAWFKARKEKSTYLKTVEYYSRIKSTRSFEELLRSRAFDRIERLKKIDKLNLFYLGTDELQDKSGILQGLEHLGNLFHFTKIDGSYGQHITGSTEIRKKINADRLLEIFKNLHESKNVPHILFSQTFSSYIDANVFTKLKELYGTIIINIGMDDRHQYWAGTHPLIPHIDLALTAAPECVDWYLKEGCPALFFPEASDSKIFYPMPSLPKAHSVSFVGGRYGIREKIVLALRASGIEVTTFGSGWGSGYLPIEDVPKLFAQSKLVLGIGTIGHSSDFFALKMRDFDGPMSGSCYITHNNNDLSVLFEIGKEIITYQTINDCVEKVKYYLANDKEREEIALAGYLKASSLHTWSKRFEGVLSKLNFRQFD